jgi:hypothetical protein
MVELQKVFLHMNETKKEKKKISDIYKEVLSNSKPYQDALEAFTATKTKKQQIESALKAELRSELDQLDAFNMSIASDIELINDIALTTLMKGETVELTDEYDTKYEPVFSVKFKKAG